MTRGVVRVARGLLSIAALAMATGREAGADPATPPPVVGKGSRFDAVPHGPTVEERLAAIQKRIQAVLVYPPLARQRGTQGTTRLAFEIGADGRARGVAVAQSSGFALLDRAALRALHDADPLPYVSGRLEVPVRFELASPPDVAASD